MVKLVIDLTINGRHGLRVVNIAIGDVFEGKSGRGVIVFNH